MNTRFTTSMFKTVIITAVCQSLLIAVTIFGTQLSDNDASLHNKKAIVKERSERQATDITHYELAKR